jgi:hypothetical protein
MGSNLPRYANGGAVYARGGGGQKQCGTFK